jgi:hypothetical protein
MRTMPYTENADPNLAIDRKDIADAMFICANIDKLLPSRVIPYTESAEPMDFLVRTEMLEPK